MRDTLFWGLYNKDPTIYGTILGSPIFGNPSFRDCDIRTRGVHENERYGVKTTQRAQYPLIKEYSLNHNMKPYII